MLFPPPDYLHNWGIEPRSPKSLRSEPPGKPKNTGMSSLPFSRGSFWPRNQTRVPCIAGRFFTSWATREAQCYSLWGHKDSDMTEWLNNNKVSPGNSSAVKAESQYTKSKVYVNSPFSNSSGIALSGMLGRIPCILMKYKNLYGLLWWLR